MSTQHARQISRRRFLGGVTLAGTAGLLGLHLRPAAAEPPPETTRIRLLQFTSSCQAPLNLSEELLRTEGFTDVQWVRTDVRVVVMSGEPQGALKVRQHEPRPADPWGSPYGGFGKSPFGSGGFLRRF